MLISPINSFNNNAFVNNTNNAQSFKAKPMYFRYNESIPKHLKKETIVSKEVVSAIKKIMNMEFSNYERLSDSVIKLCFGTAPISLLLLGSRTSKGCNAVCVAEKLLDKNMLKNDNLVESLVDNYVSGNKEAIQQLGGAGKGFFINTNDFMTDADIRFAAMCSVMTPEHVEEANRMSQRLFMPQDFVQEDCFIAEVC